MKVFVCLKQVPDTETKIKVLPDQSGVDTAGVKWVVNPYDEFAIEEAIKFREANAGAQVIVITLGPKARASEALRTALAMGADEGIVINAPESLDNFSTAKALAEAIKQEGGAHLIFTGKVAIDDNSSSVSQMLAEFLALPHVTVVSKFAKAADGFTVERDIEGGAKEVIQISGAAVLGANKGLNMPRYASLPGIMKAKKKTLKELEHSTLSVSAADQKIKYTGFSMPADKPAVQLITGDSAAQVSKLVQLLRDEAKVL